MPTLILMRHATAVRETEAPTDKARGLTASGRADAAAAGKELAALGLTPDAALVSEAVRTVQTWEAVRPAFGEMDATILPALYHADPETIWAAAAPLLEQVERVLVVAHNPGLQALCAHFAEDAHDRSRAALALMEHLPTSAFAAFSLTGDTLEAAGPRLVATWRPKG